ncbi:hypothetical protein BJF93_17065 [Xaviernesmea oryzae]|uniref:HTH marR-type domain-containing protein n=2 Tax=Xaviernesmea oryzae TaxID=464029 RepID=A0A1Q9ATP7_9HYPH|nr:hypothetical protein BJF93_17065 [Xaviernesmea oryzae]
MRDALSNCLVLNTVAAARTLVRKGDARFKPFGVTVQQFSLLAAIRFNPGEPVMSLAQKIQLDRTSLTRNLDLLERKGLVQRAADAVGNARICELTKEGSVLLDQLLRVWQQAQSEISQGFTEDEADTYLRLAKDFADR